MRSGQCGDLILCVHIYFNIYIYIYEKNVVKLAEIGTQIYSI